MSRRDVFTLHGGGPGSFSSPRSQESTCSISRMTVTMSLVVTEVQQQHLQDDGDGVSGGHTNPA